MRSTGVGPADRRAIACWTIGLTGPPQAAAGGLAAELSICSSCQQAVARFQRQ